MKDSIVSPSFSIIVHNIHPFQPIGSLHVPYVFSIYSFVYQFNDEPAGLVTCRLNPPREKQFQMTETVFRKNLLDTFESSSAERTSIVPRLGGTDVSLDATLVAMNVE